MAIIVILFFIWRIIDLIIAYIATLYDTYNEQFLYKAFILLCLNTFLQIDLLLFPAV